MTVPLETWETFAPQPPPAPGNAEFDVRLARAKGFELGVTAARLLIQNTPASEFAPEPHGEYVKLLADTSLAYEQRLAADTRSSLLERDAAARDPLTRLYNRSMIPHIFGRLNTGYQRRADLDANGRPKPNSAAIVDLDDFKRVNDTYGHPAGDKVLVAVARTLLLALRDTDSVVRLGGEEFLVVLAHQTLEDTNGIIGRLLGTIENERIEIEPGHFISVTASIGLVQIRSETPEKTLARADVALYAAKNAGKDRAVVEDPAGRRQQIFPIPRPRPKSD